MCSWMNATVQEAVLQVRCNMSSFSFLPFTSSSFEVSWDQLSCHLWYSTFVVDCVFYLVIFEYELINKSTAESFARWPHEKSAKVCWISKRWPFPSTQWMPCYSNGWLLTDPWAALLIWGPEGFDFSLTFTIAPLPHKTEKGLVTGSQQSIAS